MKNLTVNILGKGNVGSSLQQGLQNAGYQSEAVGNDAQAQIQAVQSADIVILAVPYLAIDAVLKNVGNDLAGKIVIDATNALDANMNLAVGFETSAAEDLQKKLPQSQVVKAFNTVFAPYMSSGHLEDQALTTFVASDSDEAKQQVLTIAKDIGFEAINAGPLQRARSLEPMALLLIQLGYVDGLGAKIGYHFVQK